MSWAPGCAHRGVAKRRLWHAGPTLQLDWAESLSLCDACAGEARMAGIRLWNSPPSHREILAARVERAEAQAELEKKHTNHHESGEGGRGAQPTTSTSEPAATASSGGQPAPTSPAVATPDRRGSAGAVDPAELVTDASTSGVGANAPERAPVNSHPGEGGDARVGAPAEVERPACSAEAGAAPTQEDQVRTCEVPDCDAIHSGRGRCSLHYGRAKTCGCIDDDPANDAKRWDERQARLEAARAAATAAAISAVTAPPLSTVADLEGPTIPGHEWHDEGTEDEPSVDDLAAGGTDPAVEPLAPEPATAGDVCPPLEQGAECDGEDCDSSQLEEAIGETEQPPLVLWAVFEEPAPFDAPELVDIVSASSEADALRRLHRSSTDRRWARIATSEDLGKDRISTIKACDAIHQDVVAHLEEGRKQTHQRYQKLVADYELRAQAAELKVAALVAQALLVAGGRRDWVDPGAWRKVMGVLGLLAETGKLPGDEASR